MAKEIAKKKVKSAREKRNTTSRSRSSVKVKSQSIKRRNRSGADPRLLARVVLPLTIIVALLIAIAFMAMSGYETATASNFFALRGVDVNGTVRTSAEEVKRIVTTDVEKAGVWNADLGAIQDKIEKFPFVKTATVSRSLPSRIHVDIAERTPAAAVSTSSGTYLVDGEGHLLTAAKDDRSDFPFVLKGWDESKTQQAITDNITRLKIYRKMTDEWQQFDLSTRVREVNLSNPRAPVAFVEDSGRLVGITLARDSFGRSLKTAIEVLSGKGERVKSIDAGGVHPIIQYLDF